MSHAQIPAVQLFWGMHGLVLETSISNWQNQPDLLCVCVLIFPDGCCAQIWSVFVGESPFISRFPSRLSIGPSTWKPPLQLSGEKMVGFPPESTQTLHVWCISEPESLEKPCFFCFWPLLSGLNIPRIVSGFEFRFLLNHSFAFLKARFVSKRSRAVLIARCFRPSPQKFGFSRSVSAGKGNWRDLVTRAAAWPFDEVFVGGPCFGLWCRFSIERAPTRLFHLPFDSFWANLTTHAKSEFSGFGSKKWYPPYIYKPGYLK